MRVEAAVDYAHESLRIARLAQVLMGDRDQAQCLLQLGISRKHDADGLRPALTDTLKELSSIHSRHAHIRDDDIERLSLELGDCSFAAIHEHHGPPSALAVESRA